MGGGAEGRAVPTSVRVGVGACNEPGLAETRRGKQSAPRDSARPGVSVNPAPCCCSCLQGWPRRALQVAEILSSSPPDRFCNMVLVQHHPPARRTPGGLRLLVGLSLRLCCGGPSMIILWQLGWTRKTSRDRVTAILGVTVTLGLRLTVPVPVTGRPGPGSEPRSQPGPGACRRGRGVSRLLNVCRISLVPRPSMSVSLSFFPGRLGLTPGPPPAGRRARPA
jgi:hypothetical protein